MAVIRHGSSSIRAARALATLAALVALAQPLPVTGQVAPLGEEFQVNSFTTGNQLEPAVASDPQGNFIVVWESLGGTGTDPNLSIQARRYAADGSALGGEFQVNSYTTEAQRNPDVAVDASGNAFVVWQSFGSGGTDTDNWSIQGQRYDAEGDPLGEQFQINSYTPSGAKLPAVAADSEGNFIVAWQSFGSSGPDTSNDGLLAQRYDSDGLPAGGEFQVNLYTLGGQRYPDLAANSQGDFVVVWHSFLSSGTDQNYGIHGRRFAADGSPLGDDFQVNSFEANRQRYPAVATDPGDHFVVVWESNGSSGSDTSSYSIQAQRFDADGLRLGGEFQVNAQTTDSQLRPAVATVAEGNFVVTWHSRAGGGTDTSLYSVQARQFTATGLALGGELQVNTHTPGHQLRSVVAGDPGGELVVAWMSAGSGGTDSLGFSVQAQRLHGLFGDGFESSDTLRWSATIP